MPKQWLSLAEAEQRALEITGLHVKDARSQIIQGILNHEIPTMGRGERNGYFICPLSTEAWAETLSREAIDWKASTLSWNPRDRDGPHLLAKTPWEGRLVVSVGSAALERYLAPAAPATAAAAATAPANSGPDHEGSRRGAPRRYDRDAVFAECVRLANTVDGLPIAADGSTDWPAVKRHLADWCAARGEYPGKDWFDNIVKTLRAAR
jgi:hypothetical protein